MYCNLRVQNLKHIYQKCLTFSLESKRKHIFANLNSWNLRGHVTQTFKDICFNGYGQYLAINIHTNLIQSFYKISVSYLFPELLSILVQLALTTCNHWLKNNMYLCQKYSGFDINKAKCPLIVIRLLPLRDPVYG